MKTLTTIETDSSQCDVMLLTSCMTFCDLESFFSQWWTCQLTVTRPALKTA